MGILHTSMKLLILVVLFTFLAATVYGQSYGNNYACPRENARCPQFWVPFKGACYRYFGDRVTWETANSRCRESYSHEGRADLVSIHDDQENDFAYDLFRTAAGDTDDHAGGPPYYGAWIGFYQKTQGSAGPFYWSDDTYNGDYDSWLPGQPDNAGNNEDCAHFWRRNDDDDERKSWNDLPCSRELPYICKVKPNCY